MNIEKSKQDCVEQACSIVANRARIENAKYNKVALRWRILGKIDRGESYGEVLEWATTAPFKQCGKSPRGYA